MLYFQQKQYEDNLKVNLFGCAKDMFEVPDDFDDIYISELFEEEIFPE